MDFKNAAPNPESLTNNNITPNAEQKPLKVKIIKLKGLDDQLYSIVFNLLEKSILIESFDLNDISNTKYVINLTLDNFHKLNYFFIQFSSIEQIFDLLEDMQENEFKITKNNSDIIEFSLLIEIRKKINEILVKLKVQKNDINIIVYNLCEKFKEINIIKENIKNLKQNKELMSEIEKLKQKNEYLEKTINLINEKLENKIKDDNQIIEDLKNKNQQLNEKIENMNKELDNYKKNNNNNLTQINNNIENTNNKINKNTLLIDYNKKYINNYNILFNLNDKIIDELSESLNHITKNNIIIDSNVIKNNFELAQINNGIKHQLKRNIRRLNLLFRCTCDGDSNSKFHSNCDNHSNLLWVIESAENRKFGGFTSLTYSSNGGAKYDDKAFIFSLNNRENYYIIKGKYALRFDNRGVIFGQTSNTGSEFHISNAEPCLTQYNSYDDTGKNNCYDYGKRRHVLAGKLQFVVLDYEVFELEFD